MASYTTTDSGTPTKESAFIELARERFTQGQDAIKDQRERELKALRFYNDDQWPDEIKKARAGTQGNANQPAVPARPCITINQVKEPVKQVTNQIRQSEMGAQIVPADDFGELAEEIDPTEIELREGLLRRIQRAPETADAIRWMGERAAISGTGYMGVMTRYLKGKTFDQEPYVCRFYNQASVTLDPMHEQPDGSDAEWGFVGVDMPWEEYKAQFGEINGKKNKVCDYNDDEFRALGEEIPDWFVSEGETRTCRVLDYYYTEREPRELCLLADGSAVWREELPEGVEPIQTRQEPKKIIKWAKIDGCQKLEETDWPGPDLPLIKCLGEEIQPYDGERRAVGMVTESAQEGNRGFNYMISKFVETVGLAPIPPIMMADGQDEGFEAEYAAMNVRTLGVLHYKQRDLDGNQAPPPFRPPVDTQIQPIAVGMQIFKDAVLSTIGQPSPTLGEVDPSIKTKGGLERLLSQAQFGNSNYLDNLAKSVRRMAVILNGLFYPLYGQRQGRMVRIVNGEGEPETVMVNPITGSPEKPGKVYRLTEAGSSADIAIKVTKNYETRRDQESSMLGELISANPEFMTWYGDIFLKNTDIPDSDHLAERAKLMLAPPIQKMLADKEKGEPIPAHAAQQIAQLEGKLSELAEVNQKMLEDLKTDGVKQQAETQRAVMEAENKAAIEQLKAMSQQQLAELKLQFEQWKVQFEAQQAALTREDEQRHEMSLAAAEAAQKEKDAEAQRQHDANMGRQAAEAGELSGQAGHQRTLEQGERSHAQTLEAQAAKPTKGDE
jgi:hypothetical protein